MSDPLTTIKYRYAQDETGAIIDINSLSEQDRKDYFCLGCGSVLRPALGKVRKNHFRHKTKENCSLETYLHKMGINIFYNIYSECLEKRIPFIIEKQVNNVCNFCKEAPCYQGLSCVTQDLTENFKRISIEKRDFCGTDVFIPDLLLEDNSGNKIYIEVVVTHRSEEKKINSNIPIIEIFIDDEDDLEKIKNKKLSQLDSKNQFYNFINNPIIIDHSKNCLILRSVKEHERHDRDVKESLMSFYQQALLENKTFYIEIKQPKICRACEGGPCRIDTVVKYFNLLKNFRTIVNEPPVEGEVNDRLAIIDINKKKKIYFETSYFFKKRIGSLDDSNNIHYIEMDIPITINKNFNWEFIQHEKKLIIHNIDPSKIYVEEPENCKTIIHVFTLKESGECKIKKFTYFKYLKKRTSWFYSKTVKKQDNETFIEEVESAYLKGLFVKNCYLCRYHTGANKYYDLNELRKDVFCKFLKVTCSSNQASSCEYYKPDKKVIGTERYSERWRNNW